MAHASARRWGAGAGVALLAVAALWLTLSGRPDPTVTDEQSVIVSPRPFSTTLTLVGTIIPGQQTALTAPFDGAVTALNFDYGARVEQGQVLLRLDVADLSQRRNEAEAAYLKSAQAAADLSDWPNGAEVSRVRRGVEAASADLGTTRKQVEETRRLLDRGLVSRNEYEGLVQQQANQQRFLASAQDDLDAALRRGLGANRRIVGLELASARARLADLELRLQRAVVVAPVAGVIVRPAAKERETVAGVQVGQPLTRGQPIGSIARSGDLAVTFRLDEIDANRVRPGQTVSVTGPGFEGLILDGRIDDVAGEATPQGSGSAAKAIFAAKARLDPLAPAAADTVRIGMSANVTVTLYEAASALVVPAEAVTGGPVEGSVRVRSPRNRAVRTVTVQLGHVATDGVEILSGLKTGDEVVWTPPAPPAPPT